METGGDLIHFWVSRMAMLGMKLTGQVGSNLLICELPVKEISVHCAVLFGLKFVAVEGLCSTLEMSNHAVLRRSV